MKKDGRYIRFSSLVWNYSVNSKYIEGFGVSSSEEDLSYAKKFFEAFSKTDNSMNEFKEALKMEQYYLEKRKELLKKCKLEYEEFFKNAHETLPELFII